MLKISIVCVGKIKEKYLNDGIAEFSKRITPFAKMEVISINEEKMPAEPSEAEKQQVLQKETERLIAAIPNVDYIIALDVVGKQLSSPQLAEVIDDLALRGKSRVAFVIGGAFGYSDALRKKADMFLSFSKMTFTHQMIRLLLFEQIYRAFKISTNQPYHL